MKEKLEKYFFNLIYQKEKGVFKFFLLLLLWILSLGYVIIVQLRTFLYRIGIFKQKKLECFVISIGNIVTGGVGKTPAVIMLVHMLTQQGRRVAVLSRGYKNKPPHLYPPQTDGFLKRGGRLANRLQKEKKDILLVSDGKEIFLNSFWAGDEPYLLAKTCKGSPVLVDKDRYKTGSYALEKYATQILVLDDGFQHLSLYRDLDIVVIDSLFPFSNGYFLPRGFLREPLRGLKRADVFFLTHVDQVKEEALNITINKLKEINSKATIVKTVHQPVEVFQLGSEYNVEPVDFLKNQKVVALCSIGNPLSFRKTLESLGAKITKFLDFCDHHFYEKRKIEEILKEMENDAVFVTTQKDGVKIEELKLGKELMNIFVLKIELRIIAEEGDWQSKIREKIYAEK